MLKKPYPQDMLPDVDYQMLSDLSSDRITVIENAATEVLCEVVDDMKKILFKENIVQRPLVMVAHLSGYLGFLTVVTMGEEEAIRLQAPIIQFIKTQANVSYELHTKYPITLQDTPPEEKLHNAGQLNQLSPGGIFVQTIHIYRVLLSTLKELHSHREAQPGLSNKKQTTILCPQEEFLSLLKKMSIYAQKKWKGRLSIIYLVNQISMQLAWLMGCIADEKNDPLSDYLEHAELFIEIYIQYADKYMKAMAPIEQIYAELRPKFH